MDNCFCTIITRSHLGWALALCDSLRQWDPALAFIILVTDVDDPASLDHGGRSGVEFRSLSEMRATELGAAIAAKYPRNSDELRWSMKPVLMLDLLQRFNKVMYGDCDLHFFSDPAWLWSELDHATVLLSPHWRSATATVDRPNFDLLYVGGLYNGGFVAASRGGEAPLQAWGANCLEVCIKDFTQGQYVDQTHLNLLPVYFDRVQVLKHRGCNVANWNMIECTRTKGSGNEVLINGIFPIVFIHFTRSLIDGVVSGSDALLLPHLTILRDRLLTAGFPMDVIAESEKRLAEKNKEPDTSVRGRLGRAMKRVTGGK
jgi:hypothetical protein